MNLNKVMIAGRLTRDPEVKFLANERAVCDFALAINRKYKSKDGEAHEEVTFLDCQAWGRTAELVGQFLAKGRSCYVEGYLKTESWDDKATGQKRSKIKVVADNVQFLDRAQKADGEQESPAIAHHANKPYDSQANRAGAGPIKPASGGAHVDDDGGPPFMRLNEWGL